MRHTPPPDNPLEAPLDPAWRALLDRIDDRHDRSFLRRLASYCSFHGVAPPALDDAMLTAFGKAVADARIDRPKQVVRDAVNAWNRAAEALAGWPQIRLVLVDRRKNVSIKADRLPETFIIDAMAYLQKSGGIGLFDAKRRTTLRPTTQKDRLIKIRQLATIYAEAGGDISRLKTLRDLVTPDAMTWILERLWGDGAGENNGHHYNRARLLRLIAEHWVNLPPEELEPFKAAESRFRPDQKGMTHRNKAKLRLFLDDANCQKIVGLASGVLANLDAANPSVSDAVLLQSALAVAILLNAPMRMKNLAELNLDRNFDWVSADICHIVIPHPNVKNRMDLEYPLGATAIRLLDAYLKVYRPLLQKDAIDTRAVFISWNGRPKSESALSAQLTKFIKDQTGFHLNPHAFRHLVGLMFLRRFPGQYEPVRHLLGHKDIKTTIQFYLGLEQTDTFKRLDAILDSYRGGHIGAP